MAATRVRTIAAVDSGIELHPQLEPEELDRLMREASGNQGLRIRLAA